MLKHPRVCQPRLYLCYVNLMKNYAIRANIQLWLIGMATDIRKEE